MEEQRQEVFKCNGDCLNCRKNPNERREQWRYCAAQFTYNTMKMVGDLQESLNAMKGTVEYLKVKVEAIQNSEANVFDPTKEDTAQNGDGAEVEAPI